MNPAKFLVAIVILAIPFYGSASNDSFEKLFYITSGKKGIESLKENIKHIDIIAPQSYTLSKDLKVSGSVDSAILKLAKDNNVKVMPLIVNAGFSQKIIHDLLTSSTIERDRVINFMVSEAIKNSYIGWQFDFEHISYTDRNAYSEFVERAYKIFRKNNLMLSIAAVARVNDEQNDFFRNWSGAFDYKRLARSLDFISIMTYDDPDSEGPTASMPFVESVYNYLDDKVPPEKLSLGIPLYYWGWSVNPHKKIRLGGTYERLQYLRANYKVTEGFDNTLKVPYLKYSVGNGQYIVWHENGKSFENKINFMKKNNLRGFSAWVLGLENPAIWKSLDMTDSVLQKIDAMTLEEKVGQMFLVGIFDNNSNAILEKLIIDKKIGSIILMNQNTKDGRVIDVTTKLQSIASSTHQPPLLISVDQEGGTVSRIKDKDSDLTAQGEIKSSKQAYDVAYTRGKELRSKGININFSPVLEYITNSKSFLYSRVFHGTKEEIISYGENMVKGYRDAGITSTIKHFPGHDNQSVDSHKNLPISNITKENINEHASVFAKVIDDEKPEMIMTAHVLFPKIDPVYPATLSPYFINILRNDYKYDGIIITDDMNMGAISKSFGVEKSALQAVIAGNDILLYVATPNTINRAYQSIITAVKAGYLSEERIDASVYRVLKLKESLL